MHHSRQGSHANSPPLGSHSHACSGCIAALWQCCRRSLGAAEAGLQRLCDHLLLGDSCSSWLECAGAWWALLVWLWMVAWLLEA